MTTKELPHDEHHPSESLPRPKDKKHIFFDLAQGMEAIHLIDDLTDSEDIEEACKKALTFLRKVKHDMLEKHNQTHRYNCGFLDRWDTSRVIFGENEETGEPNRMLDEDQWYYVKEALENWLSYYLGEPLDEFLTNLHEELEQAKLLTKEQEQDDG